MCLSACASLRRELSHPEIQATVSILQQFCIEPRESHLRAVSHCAKYLRGVFKKTLVYPPIKPRLEASVDSDWAADTETRFSRKGHETRANGVAIINTKSSLSRCIALSATEAEYIAVCDLVCDLIYFSGLFKDFGYPQERIMVDEDNTGVLSYLRDRHEYVKRRHIDIKFKFVQEFWDKLFELRDVRGDVNRADIYTKATIEYNKFISVRDEILPGTDETDYSALFAENDVKHTRRMTYACAVKNDVNEKAEECRINRFSHGSSNPALVYRYSCFHE